jgi:hypothetical protein
MKKTLVTTALVFISICGFAQNKTVETKNGIIYGGFGSFRIFYSNSDITFQKNGHPGFDFTLYDVKARDEGGLHFNTAPMFAWELGYYFKKKKFGLEYHYDHIKYYVEEDQRVHMKGSINGVILDKDTTLGADFVKMEHSDGGNYAMVNVVKWIPLAADKKGNHVLNAVVKGGLGLVNPKTNTTIMGEHRDDKYHISGYVTGIETGLRYNFFRHFFLQGSFKGTYANYSQFLIAGGYGHQRWFAAQFIYMLGGQFAL